MSLSKFVQYPSRVRLEGKGIYRKKLNEGGKGGRKKDEKIRGWREEMAFLGMNEDG